VDAVRNREAAGRQGADPGVIESKANFIEHPELIAQRIGRYAKLVGRENVMAGSDCGYGTWVGQAAVDPTSCGRRWPHWPKAHASRRSSLEMK